MNPVFVPGKPLNEPLERIRMALRGPEIAHIVFAVVDDETLRGEAFAEMGERLSGQFDLYEFDYRQEETRSLGRFCRSIRRRDLSVCVFAQGLETLAKRDAAGYEEAIGLLNSHREDVRDTQTQLVFWLTEKTLGDILRDAPDFSEWRTETVTLLPPTDKRVPKSMVAQMSLREAERLRYDARQLEQRLARPGIAPAMQADFQMRLGVILKQLGLDPEGNTLRTAAELYAEQGDFAQIERLYLDYLIRTNTYLDPRGVMQTTRSASLRLDEVYVALQAEREVGGGWTMDRRGEAMRRDEADPERLREQEMFGRERRTERVGLAEVVRKHIRMVILGDPGAGKTTLMRFLTLQFALARRNENRSEATRVHDAAGEDYGEVRLPIPVRISRFAEALEQHPTLSLRRYLSQAFGEVETPEPALAEVFLGALQAGKAFVLLDGLDEIVRPDIRASIAQRIEEFGAAHPGNRILITSRIVGYRSAPLGGEVAEFTLCDLEAEQISRFLKNWCYAYERFRTPEAAPADIAREADGEIEALEQALQDSPGVRRFAANPLLLTIIALIHRNGASLPTRRVDLYELATKTLLRDWQLARGIPEVQCVQESEALRLLGPMAFWLHEHRPSGMASERDVKAKLAELLAEWRSAKPDDPEILAAVDDFLTRVREHTGLFVERAPGYFGFMHLTFEEYFAGRELVRRRRDAARNIYKFRHQPRWEEPILLAIAFESRDHPEDATDLIRTAILAQGEEAREANFTPSELENILHRDLLFAAHCIGDAPNTDTNLQHYIVHNLVRIYFDRNGEGKYVPLREKILSELRYSKNKITVGFILPLILENLRNANTLVRWAAAEALGELGSGSSEVVATLLEAMRSDRDESVRRAVAQALGALGSGSSEVLSVLLETMRSDKSELVRGASILALGRLGSGSSEVLSVLSEAMRSEKSTFVRRVSAQALGQLGSSSSEVESALLEALRLDEDDSVRRVAVEALGRLGSGSSEVFSVLLEAMRSDRASWIHGASAFAISKICRGKLAGDYAKVQSALLTALTGNENLGSYYEEGAEHVYDPIWTALWTISRSGSAQGAG